MADEGGETLHLLHPDGTVTVQFMSTDEVGDTYITDADGQRQYITTESGEYLTTAASCPTQYILAIDSDGQIIATAPAAEFITGDSEEGFEEEQGEDVELEQEEGDEVLLEEEGEDVNQEQEHGEDEDNNLTVTLGEGEEVPEEVHETSIEEILEQEEEHLETEESNGEMQSLETGLEELDQDQEQQQESKKEQQQKEIVLEQDEQERQHCANCFSKLIFQRGRSRKFTDKLYPCKEFPTLFPQNKHVGKEVTVLEALELLFDIKEKASTSSIGLCEDYVFCHRCVNSLLKLHTLFVEFTEASESPSFMKSIFAQYGILNEFFNVIREFKQEVDLEREPVTTSEEIPEQARLGSNENDAEEKKVSGEDVAPEITPTRTASVTNTSKNTKSMSKPNTKSTETAKGRKENAATPTSECTRLPRSCKKRQDYRALAKVGQYDSDDHGEGDHSSQEDNHGEDESASATLTPGSPSYDELELIGSMPLKKRQSRLLNLKNRIKAYSEECPDESEAPQPATEKRKRGRPRKSLPVETKPLSEKIKIKEEPGSKKRETTEETDGSTTLAYEDRTEDPDKVQSLGPTPKLKREVGSDGDDWMEADGPEEEQERHGEVEIDWKKIKGLRKKGKWIQCSKCCATFLKQSHYIDHLRVHSENNFPCSECHGAFNTPRNLKRHFSLNHTVRAKKVSLPRQFTCPECNFSFTRQYHLKGHLINQHKIDPDTVIGDFPCPVCNKKHFTEASLQEHLNRKHLVRIKEKKNQCEECGMKFLKKSDLDNHTTTHTNIRRFMCDVCGFCSKRPQDLTRHRKLVHLKEVKHTCSTCGKGFLSLWQMKSHQLSHDERKLFPCPEPGCGKSFRCPNNLRQHTHVHQGVKHVCQYCGESYSRTAYLARHIKVNHLGIEVPTNRPKRAKEVPHPVIIRPPKIKKAKRTYEILENTIGILQPEPLELDIDVPTEDGHTQQVILHGFDDRYEGVIMEYIIG